MTYEIEAIVAALRHQARAELLVLDGTLQKFASTLSIEQRIELGSAFAELQRLLHGREAPPAPRLAPNVFLLGSKRGFVSGRVGPGEKISNADCFRQMTDGFPGPNDEGMPKEGA